MNDFFDFTLTPRMAEDIRAVAAPIQVLDPVAQMAREVCLMRMAAADAVRRHAANTPQREASLEQELKTARGAVRELEGKVFSQEQALTVLRACVARYQRDEANPPGYLQDAVIRAAGLGALHEERDAAIRERDALRARLAEIEAQEPAALSKAGDLFWAGNPQDWRGGAEQMREEAAQQCDRLGGPMDVPAPDQAWVAANALAQAIRALPLPTGERQAVRLTDEEIDAVAAEVDCIEVHTDGATEFARAIESAVLAANGVRDGAA